MQRSAYLKYFRKTQETTKPSERSFDQSSSNLIDEGQPFTQKQEKYESMQQKQVDKTKQQQSDYLSGQGPQKRDEKFKYIDLNSQKKYLKKNIRVHNISSLSLQRSNQTEGNESLSKHNKMIDWGKQLRNKPDGIISPGVKIKKQISQSVHNPGDRKQAKVNFNRIRTLQSTSLYDPCMSHEKFFTSPIKPYDRNKTAQNKKFRTLKTTFGDLNSSCRNYNDEYTMSLENLRMGWRLVNAKSMIQEYLNSTYFTYHLYNGNMINKEKMKPKEQKDKKKINLKQMKNVYKVFFDKNVLFNRAVQKTPQLLQTIKSKNNQLPQYILNQSKINQISKENSFQASKVDFSMNSQLIKGQSCENQGKQGFSKKSKPCFFRQTYGKNNASFNVKICQQSKRGTSKCSRSKQNSFVRQSRFQTEPNQLKSEQDDFHQKQTFGKGNTIIQIRDLDIEGTCMVKNQDLLVLQLMGKNTRIAVKGICTPAIKYGQVKKGLRFATDIKVGDFLPLKIWKYHGINLIELGIIDLNLIIYRERNKYFPNQYQIQQTNEGIQDLQFYCQQRMSKSGQKQERQIIYYHTRQKLRKNKKAQIEVSVSLNCLIYNKKFSRPKGCENEFSDKENILECQQQQGK